MVFGTRLEIPMATEKSDKRKVLDFARTDKMKGEKNESTKAKIKSCKK